MLKVQRWPVVALAALCIFQIAAVMGYLNRQGRLSIVPIYDDVVYFIDGMKRLSVLDQAGLQGFAAEYLTNPPHAPFMAASATFGYLLTGGATWGPYLLNSGWVLAIAYLLYVTLRDVPAWSRFGLVVAALSAPMFGFVIAEFRPDPSWGLLVGCSVVALAGVDLTAVSPLRLVALGLLFGTAVVAKPTGFMPAGAVIGAAFLAQLVATNILLPKAEKKDLARNTGIVALGAAAVLVPYFSVAGADIVAYILTVLKGDSAVWETKTDAIGHLSYYIARDTGRAMLGWFWYLAVPTLILCGALLIRCTDRRALCGFVGVCVALLLAYLAVSVSHVKSLMIGSLFYGTAIAATVWAAGQIVLRARLPQVVVVVLGVAIFIVQWTPRAGMLHRSDPSMIATDTATKAAFPAVLQAMQESAGTVMVTVPGPVYAGTLDFLALQQGVSRPFISGYTWATWEQFTSGVEASSTIVLSEAGMRGQALGFAFPSVQFQERLLAALRADARFVGRPVYTDEAGRSVWLFGRK